MLKPDSPRIVFVPGKNPKPPPELHRQALWRCLIEGVRRADASAHAGLGAAPEAFTLAAWNRSYYGTERDIGLDLPWIDALIARDEASTQDRHEAGHWRRVLLRIAYLIGDALPMLIPLIPDPAVKTTIEETARYFSNRDSIGDTVRRPLEETIRRHCAHGAPLLVIAHSLGSVIAYDALWSLTHKRRSACPVDLLLTIGSPLGTKFVQHRLLGHDRHGRERYPANIRRWINVTAVGDMTAFDPNIRDDFSEMLELGMIEDLRDNVEPVFNYYRTPEGLNVHRSYGYLVNPAVGRIVADWWKRANARVERGADPG